MVEIHIIKLIVSYFLFFIIGVISYKVYIVFNEFKELKRQINAYKKSQEKLKNEIDIELNKILDDDDYDNRGSK